jgi:heme exporter protein A
MPGGNEHTAALEARNLTCIRGGRTLFSSLSFEVRPGHVLILRGANGSGKTSLLRIIAGLLTADEGELYWAGVAGEDAVNALQENMHLIGHLTALKPVLNVRDNISIWARLHGSDGQVAEALHALDLTELAELPVRFLSEGQKRRTALARLLAHQKPIWLLDEPLAGLDRASSARLVETINQHLIGGGIAVIATHQPLQLDTNLQSDLQVGAAP